MPAFALPSLNSSMMKHTFLRFYDRIFVEMPSATIVFVAMCFATTLSDAQDVSSTELPFNRDIINRYSLDHLPRSLSIRQGADVWFGYDLERAKLYKLWRAPANSSGLEKYDFTVRSVGTTLYEDKSEAVWQLQRRNELIPLRTYFRHCSHQAESIELKWELTSDCRTMYLIERIPVSGKSLGATPVRDLRVEGLQEEEALVPLNPTQSVWSVIKSDGTTTVSFQDSKWHRLTLP
jgi:hypothetical protein